MKIRDAKPADTRAIVRLMRDFAVYEELLEHFEITEEKLARVLFGDKPFVHCLVAEDNDDISAYAIFYPNFATFRGQLGMYLEDLYVSPGSRGTGVGAAMLRRIARFAADQGFERIDFQVLEWNESAIAFYEKLGADRSDDERHFKFTDTAFRELSSQK